jgi:hypothetical protein
METGWSDFFVAEVGAAAALGGLINVAISINLQRILKNRHVLPGVPARRSPRSSAPCWWRAPD